VKMRWKAELPKMPRLPRVPPDAIQDIAPTQAARAEGSGEPAALGPLPAPSAYREKNPAEPPPADYKAPSIVAEHGGLALLFLGAAIAFALYCWKAPRWAAPHRSVALDTPAEAGASARGETARTRGPETSQSPIYIETLPDKER